MDMGPKLRQFVWQLQATSCVRMSTSAMNAANYQPTIVNISPTLRLHRFNNNDESAPVTLLLPWVGATERALDRFRRLYAERGFNVLTGYAKPMSFIWPRSARPVVAEMVEYLRTKTGTGPIVVHAFSLGAYLYATILTRLLEQHKEFSELRPRIRGQVFDSIVIGTVKEMRAGTGQMLTDNRFLQQLISASAAAYFFLTHAYTMALYEEVIDAFWKNPFTTPVLFYYSQRDPMCHVQTMEQFLSAWEARTGQPAHHRSFTDAPHSQILRTHPQEYRDTLFQYLDAVKVGYSPVLSKL